MSFTVSGLSPSLFQPLFGLDDEALACRGAVRRIAQAGGRYPCRITLEDAAPGESLLLLNYEHLDAAASPYRSRHAIYVNEAAAEAKVFTDEVPAVLRGRPIALRAYDAEGMMVWAELVSPDADMQAAIDRGLAEPGVEYLHAHNPARGCYAARIDRG
jgi:hypothetical protein